MARTVQLACGRCGHRQTVIVDESAEKAEASAQSAIDAGDTSTAEALRQRPLASLPTSLPVGGIITPV